MGEGGVDLGIAQREARRVAETQIDVQTGFPLELGAGGVQHPRRVIHGDHPKPGPRQLQGEDAGPGADVGDPQSGRDQARQRPRPQQVVAPDLSQGVPLRTHRVEEGAAAGSPRLDHPGQGRQVSIRGGVVSEGTADQLPRLPPVPASRAGRTGRGRRCRLAGPGGDPPPGGSPGDERPWTAPSRGPPSAPGRRAPPAPGGRGSVSVSDRRGS